MDGLNGLFVGIRRKGSVGEVWREGFNEARLEGCLLVSRVWRPGHQGMRRVVGTEGTGEELFGKEFEVLVYHEDFGF